MSSLRLRRTSEISADVVTAHNSMVSVRNDPEALAREVAKWSPEILYKALALDKGKVLPIAGYFIGAGIDILDPGVWQGIGQFKLYVEIQKLFENGMVDAFEQAELRQLL